ncbi:MAG: histone deacetylase family protein [Gammaproteobacteria bacterium]
MTMRIFHSPRSVEHASPTFFRRGKSIPSPESPARYLLLRNALVTAGFTLTDAADNGLEPLLGVHSQAYLSFLAEAWSRRAEIDANAEELLTTQFSRTQMHRRPSGLLGLLGYYSADTSTPIRAETWGSIYGTAQAAISAADAAIAEGRAYALCRPPGHHAFADCAGGFCYINNTAAAAQRMRSALRGRVAVLDIDVHHGNGTQGIFYERSDVLTVSLHADTNTYFPFFSGYADETGSGEGKGFNYNMPLPHGSGDEVFLSAIAAGLDRIAQFAPAGLVIALGLDAAASDPMGVLKVTTEGFVRAAKVIEAAARRMRVPVTLVQEGGYVCPELPINLVAFLRQFGG